MKLKSWNDLPEKLKTEEVKKYYDILASKQGSLLLKRVFDAAASASMLALLAPLFALIAAAIKIDSEGPVFYRQERITAYGRKFKIHKFRTMIQNADKGSKITGSNDSRVTGVGSLLRKFKVDELSQLIDVLKGDMSFVGTRPEVKKFVDSYTPEMMATLLMPAGITSSASVFYKDENRLLKMSDDIEKTYVETILPDKMRYNLNDIENFSLFNDFKILLRTAFALLGFEKKETERDKPLVALITNHDDDVYCFRKEVLEGLKKEGFDLLVSCPYGEKLDLMGDIDFKLDSPRIDRRGTNIFKDAGLFAHYFGLIKKEIPDVVLTYTAKPNVYASIAARLNKVPVLNNVTGFGSIASENSLLNRFVMFLFKTAYSKSSCVFFQNETNMTVATENGMISGKARLIPGSGVNTERYPLQHYPEGGNGVEGDTVVFNYIGRIMKDKGVDDYLKAAEIIKGEYPNTEFNLIGFIEETEKQYEDKLAELEKKGIVRYRGNQKDVRPFIASSHCTVHPSVYGEGMSNVLLESASSGRVLITTDNPGCKETVIEGETGFIYPKGDTEELVNRIRQFLALPNSEREKMGRKGRDYIEQNFSRNIVVKAYIDEINNILKR